MGNQKNVGFFSLFKKVWCLTLVLQLFKLLRNFFGYDWYCPVDVEKVCKNKHFIQGYKKNSRKLTFIAKKKPTH